MLTFLKYFFIVSVTTTLTLVFVETEEGKGLLARVGIGEVPAQPAKVVAKLAKPQKIDPVVERILSKPAPDLTPPSPPPQKERAVVERSPVEKPKSEMYVNYQSPVYRTSAQPGKS